MIETVRLRFYRVLHGNEIVADNLKTLEEANQKAFEYADSIDEGFSTEKIMAIFHECVIERFRISLEKSHYTDIDMVQEEEQV